MGLLAPLYALAALAIAGPILFHLIRRQPHGQLPFSSLMFLTPSPPRLTRRSRLDNWLLLLLRSLAIGLIAIAFARPYLRQDSFLNSTLSGRRVVVLLDTSGSMQRSDVWSSATDELTKLLDSLSPNDQVALYTIDSQLRAVLPMDDVGSRDAATSQQAVRAAIRDLQPTWQGTALADGLKSAADLMVSLTIAGKGDPTTENEVVLISDLHSGCHLESLQGFAWPESISLDVRRVLPAIPGNARVSLMERDETQDDRSHDEANQVRVRIENDIDSLEQSFQLAWANDRGAISAGRTTIQVPPGQVRVVRMTARPANVDRIVLSGDAWHDDNIAYLVEPLTTLERIVFCGAEPAKAEDDLSYFLERAPLSTERFRREVLKATPQQLSVLLSESETKAVVLEPLAELVPQAAMLRKFASAGGVVLICLAREAHNAVATELLGALLEEPEVRISEASSADFALLANIDFAHPVFAPFADPRFNDFGKIRFWSHRQVSLPEDAALHTVVSYDDRTPMLLEQQLGTGRIWLLTSGWQPTASGLGLSSKFVPLLMGMLDPAGRTRQQQFTYEVGDPIDIEEFSNLQVQDSHGRSVEERLWVQETRQLTILEPGLFWLADDQGRRQVAIQIPASESRLTPLDVDQFEQYGIKLGKVESDSARRQTMRQLQVEELEGKQRLWQWLLAACLGILALETLLAGWFTKRL